MKQKRGFGILFLPFMIFILLISTTCKKKETEKEAEPVISRSAKILNHAMDEYWNTMLTEYNSLRLKFGIKVEKLHDVSYSHAHSLTEKAQAMLDKLVEVDAQELTHEEWLSREILKWYLSNAVEAHKYYWLVFSITPYASPIPGEHLVFTTFQFNNNEDCDHYIHLLKQYPAFMKNFQDKLQGQEERGILLPKEELGLVIPFLSSYIKDGDESIFFVKDERLEKVAPQTAKEFQGQIKEMISAEVNPSLLNMVEYLKGDYSQKAPDDVGLWQYPAGSEYYAFLVKLNTTKDITPEEVHEIGLKHVKLNYDGIAKIKDEVGFEGSLDEFIHFLKTDRRFFPKTADEIGDKLRSFIAGMDAKIDQYFLQKPKAPYGTERLDPSLEGSMTFGYYNGPTATNSKGIYYYNGSTPEKRSLIQSENLIYHELVPGHHFHSALQSENQSLPKFRRESWVNAFGEGWAEYASWLGKEMGLYKDPYDLCGRYLSDMFLSARLVVDTGMNHLKWPRTKAAEYMQANSFFTPTQIYTESLRYSVDIPGQALGYKMGSIQMHDIRKRAERELGDKFDIKKFHDAILGSASMPFPILEKHIDWFIAKELGNTKE